MTGILGISYFGSRENSASEKDSALLTQAAPKPSEPTNQPAPLLVNPSTVHLANPQNSPAPSAIAAFHRWAQKTAASGFIQADENKGLDLAKARASAMKALIQTDPAAALRQALPADLRASLPKNIASAIEQPVKTTGMCSLRIMCNHSPDAPHDQCQETPILIGDGIDWNAYYGAQQWRSHVGQTVRFEGVAVESELAVERITPASDK